MVGAEDVVGVVASLELAQACVGGRRIGVTDGVGALVAHEVDVGRRPVRGQLGAEGRGPGLVGGGAGEVLVGRDEPQQGGPIAPAERGRVTRDARHRAAEDAELDDRPRARRVR